MKRETTFILTWSSTTFTKIHFEFSSSDTELKKFCPTSQIGKLVTKFTVHLLFHYQTWEAKLFIF